MKQALPLLLLHTTLMQFAQTHQLLIFSHRFSELHDMNGKYNPSCCCYNMANSNPQSHSAFLVGFYSLALERNLHALFCFSSLEKLEVKASFFSSTSTYV